MVHNDYAASVRIHSSVIGIQLGLLLVLPNQTDPRTGKPLELILPGEKLSAADQWQTLRVKATKKVIEAQTRRVRAELNSSDIRMQQAIVTGACAVRRGDSRVRFFLISVSFSPALRSHLTESLYQACCGSSI
jgi:hypothetical protein